MMQRMKAVCLPLAFVYTMFLFTTCESLELILSRNGAWEADSRISITCKMSSYPGQMTWRFNSTDVAKCASTLCNTLQTDGGLFLFGFDTADASFSFAITYVQLNYNGTVIECFNGSSTVRHTVVVTAKSGSDGGDNTYAIAIAALVIVCVFALFLLIAVFVICCYADKYVNKRIEGFFKKLFEDQEQLEKVEIVSMKDLQLAFRAFVNKIRSDAN